MSCFHRTDAHFGGHFFRLVILLIAGLSSGAAQAQWQPYAVMDAFARSEPIAIVDAIHDWKGEFGRGETQYLHSWLEAGMRTERWGVGLLHRRDYGLQFTSDTAELYGSVQNDRPLDVGREYGIWLKSHALIADGIRLSWFPDWREDLSLEIGLSLLHARYLMDGSLNGSAIATAEKAYSYAAWVDYSYTEDVLFERDVEQVEGWGATLDVKGEWQLAPAWQLDLQIRDLLGAIWWQDAPFTRADAYSDRSRTSASGFTEWAPLISGVEGNHSTYRQALPAKIAADLYYRYGKLSLGIGGRYQFEDTLARMGAGYRLGAWQLFAWWWPKDHGLELNADWHKLRFSLGSDAIRLDEAKLLTLSLAYRY